MGRARHPVRVQAPPFRPTGAISPVKGEAAETAREPTYAILMAGLGLIAAVPETRAGRRPLAKNRSLRIGDVPTKADDAIRGTHDHMASVRHPTRAHRSGGTRIP